jgi:hypothetical protein
MNERVTNPQYEIIGEHQLKIINEETNLLNLFSINFKLHEDEKKLNGFTMRSQNKYKIHDKNENRVILTKGRGRQFGFKEVLIFEINRSFKISLTEIPYKFIDIECNPETNKDIVLLLSSVENKLVGILNLKTGYIKVLKFLMYPFRRTIGNEFLLIGLRGGYQLIGPAELYKVNLNGEFSWGIEYTDTLDVSIFGTFTMTPYSIDLINDRIVVTSFWLVFIYKLNGNFFSKIDLSSLEKFIEKKKSQINISFNSDTEVTINLPDTSSFFGQDFQPVNTKPLIHINSGQIFFLERTGRLSSWDLDGNLKWNQSIKIFSLNEDGKHGGIYVNLIDDMIIVIDGLGRSYWIDLDGKGFLNKKYPFRPQEIIYLSNWHKWLLLKPNFNVNKPHGYIILNEEEFRGTSEVIHEVIEDADVEGAFDFGGNVIFQDCQGYLWTNVWAKE